MNSIEFIVRAYIESDGKVLLCKNKEKENWYFPGGHIEFGESATDALVREVREELGAVATITQFLGASENVFGEGKNRTQEINLVFAATFDLDEDLKSLEPHLEFGWFAPEEVGDMLIYPTTLRDALIAQRGTGAKEPLWTSEGFLS